LGDLAKRGGNHVGSNKFRVILRVAVYEFFVNGFDATHQLVPNGSVYMFHVSQRLHAVYWELGVNYRGGRNRMASILCIGGDARKIRHKSVRGYRTDSAAPLPPLYPTDSSFHEGEEEMDHELGSQIVSALRAIAENMRTTDEHIQRATGYLADISDILRQIRDGERSGPRPSDGIY